VNWFQTCFFGFFNKYVHEFGSKVPKGGGL